MFMQQFMRGRNVLYLEDLTAWAVRRPLSQQVKRGAALGRIDSWLAEILGFGHSSEQPRDVGYRQGVVSALVSRAPLFVSGSALGGAAFALILVNRCGIIPVFLYISSLSSVQIELDSIPCKNVVELVVHFDLAMAFNFGPSLFQPTDSRRGYRRRGPIHCISNGFLYRALL